MEELGGEGENVLQMENQKALGEREVREVINEASKARSVRA